ncbi:hypothetical protein N7454_003851 [Penicillium verhagenii]|nr:hypothetical protein N7454_003851 [Penicillium verhagenii]
MIAQRPSFRFIATTAVASFFILSFFILSFHQSTDSARYILKTSRPNSQHCALAEASTPSNGSWDFVVGRDGQNHGLSEEQCQIAFPRLFIEIDKSAQLNQETLISYKDLDSRTVEDGMVRGIIDQGELYVVDYAAMPVTGTRARSTLNSLHRALKAYPDRRLLPSIEFTFTTEDFAENPTGPGPIWAYSKREGDDSVWLMPDFGYWAWPEVQIGPYHEVRRRIAAIDDGEALPDGTILPGLAFQDKKKQLVWRGSLATNPAIRSKLLKTALSRSWGSVRVIDWDDDNDIRYNLLPMEDHCRYMFVAHTEGRSFSGRGKYLLNCRSVMISHPLVWREAHHGALISSGADANYLEVDQNFGDLSTKIDYLIDNPQVAERIADNAVRTFRDRYLTPAAESCYWRHLVRQYALVSDFKPVLFSTDRDGKKSPRGVPFETWLLTH